MQQLHEPTSHEQLLTSGKYNYRVANRNSGLTEQWTLHRTKDNHLVHRAQVKGIVGQVMLNQIMHTEFDVDFLPHHFEMKQTLNENQAETLIEFQPGQLHQRVIENTEHADITLDLPERFGFFLPPVSTQRFIFYQYDFEQAGRQTLPFLSVRMQPIDGPALSVELRHIDHEWLDEEEIETPAGQFACRHVKRYEEQMEQELWIDDSNMVIQWRVPYSMIMTWDYLLTQYQRIE